MANTIQKAAQNQAVAERGGKDIRTLIHQMAPAIQKALPSVITPERFTRMVLTAISSTPKLADCDQTSFLAAMMNAAQLGLEPNTPLGQAYLLPYKNKNKGCFEVQFQLGYKGLIDLAYRSGDVATVQAQIVYENDTFECEFGIEPKLRHIPAEGERGNPIKVYAMFRTKSGGYGFEVMSMEDIRRHAKKYSQSYSSEYSPWKTSFEEMAKKTVLKRCLKYAPLRSDIAAAITGDGGIRHELAADMNEVPVEYIAAEAVETVTADAAPQEVADAE